MTDDQFAALKDWILALIAEATADLHDENSIIDTVRLIHIEERVREVFPNDDD